MPSRPWHEARISPTLHPTPSSTHIPKTAPCLLQNLHFIPTPNPHHPSFHSHTTPTFSSVSSLRMVRRPSISLGGGLNFMW